MNVQTLEQLRDCCRDDAAFEKLKAILAIDAKEPGLGDVGIKNSSSPNPQIPAPSESTSTEISSLTSPPYPPPLVGEGENFSLSPPSLRGEGENFSLSPPSRNGKGAGGLGLFQKWDAQSAIACIRQSLNIEDIFKATTTEVRDILNADRVAIFRFYPEADFQGEIICENAKSGTISAENVKIQDYRFGDADTAYYRQGEVQAIADIYTAGLSDCHVEILAKLQVRASLVAPLLLGDRLWGLLCVYQCSKRDWETAEIEFVTQISDRLEMALQQVDCQEILKAQSTQIARIAQREKAVAQTVDKIRRSLDIDTIFKTTVEEVRLLLNADRVVVYRFYPDWSGEFVAESVAPGWKRLMENLALLQDTYLRDTQGGRYARQETLAVDDIYKAGHADCHLQLLEGFQAKAYVIVPILQGEKLWGLLAAYQNSGPRHWEEDEVELLFQIGGQLGVGLQQAELLAQTRHQAEAFAQIVRDLQQAQTQLIQSEKMASLGQLVAGVAHEINNPVNFIYGNLSHVNDYANDLLDLVGLYQENYSPNRAIQERSEEIELDFLMEDLPKILASMKLGTDRIRQLVLSLRNFSRLDEASMKPVDIRDGLDSTLLILQYRLKAKTERVAIEVVKEYGDLPLVECYAAQMNQVFMNVLANAIDALEEEKMGLGNKDWEVGNSQSPVPSPQSPVPIIRIRTEAIDDDRVVIRISDNGPGMPAEVRDRIFDPFFTTKPVGQGTGLGLSISYQIVVQKHGGVLKCFSQPGFGTEFSIELPIQAKLDASRVAVANQRER